MSSLSRPSLLQLEFLAKRLLRVSPNQPTWNDIITERNRREDEPIKRQFVSIAYLGRGHVGKI